MAGYFLLGTLAAFGAVCALWTLYGLMLPQNAEDVLYTPVRPGEGEFSFARRYLWLRELGLVRCALVAVDLGLSNEERDWLTDRGIAVCSPAELADRLKTGAVSK